MGKERQLDVKVFAGEMARVETIFGEIEHSMLDVYYDLFKDWTEDELRKAVKNVIKTYKYNYFPRPAVFFDNKEKIRVA